MQAIELKFLGATNTKGSRIKATCERGTKTISWDHGLNTEENYYVATKALLNDFIDADKKEYGPESKSGWDRNFVMGSTKNGYVAVLTKRTK